jgi:prepilin-type N-terminal cleavage/methylation domain-containing protein
MISDPKDAPFMVTRRFSSRRGQAVRGFTLIELLIVGALIALFAGLAIFGAQQAYLDNQRKAMIGEARQVATALDMAYADVNFFPALCYLDKGLTNLFATAQQSGGSNAGNNGEDVLQFMHIYLLPTVGREQAVRRDWSRGGYFSASQSRSGVAQGRGGSRRMQLAVGGTVLGTYDWPLDAYGNPWMVYDLNINRTSGDVTFNLNDAFETGNYVSAVVSYGRNRVPGGGFLNDDPTAATGLRLFLGNLNDSSADLQYDALRFATLPGLASAWSADLPNAPGTGGNNGFAADIDTGDAIGITDPGSDDIVYTF